ncbi:tyrosinase [Madurella fahalii]|uniref:tyrosinase n=1 Tax=Madurella fahalii TaxID=1157608 RepID=A0ABQ0FZ51_9PEZI
MAYKYYPIQGIKAGLGPGNRVPIRREISEWTNSKDPVDQAQVILFLLALQRFQAVPPSSRDSYFQIAGIHGMPYRSWDEPSVTTQEVQRKGYCVHANALFPLWHRPYLLLYEQRLYEIMVDEVIPGMGMGRQVENELRAAANSWRLPFWDWAKNPQIPSLLRAPKLNITLIKRVIENPLYKFTMPRGEKMGVYGVGPLKVPDFDDAVEYGECVATSRCPTASERADTKGAWRNGVVHNDTADKFFANRESITDFDYGRTAEMVYRLLTYPLDFKSFATTARDATAVSASASSVVLDMNIEFIHNNIHYWVGGDGGHMSQIPVATFDPIFWLHHCNLDRLFAIWQTLNPEKWFAADQTRPFDQKVIGMGEVVTSKTPFRPFHKDEKGTVWNADDARDWFSLGYTYPELQPWTSNEDQEARVAALLRGITDTYAVSRKEALELGKPGSKLSGVVDVKDGGVALNDYAVSIQYSKFAMGGHPFNLELYLRPEGDVPGGPGEFGLDQFLTSVYNFSQPAAQNGETVCSNCSDLEEKDVQVTAYIPITPYLVKMIQQKQLENLEKVNVEKVLSRIYYRVAMVGKTVPEEKWKPNLNLKVDVSVCKMEYSKDPGAPPTFDEPDVIPSLGIGQRGNAGDTGDSVAPTPGVSEQSANVNTVIPLQEAVSDGGSVVVRSSSIELGPPPPKVRETTTTISLLWVSNAADIEDPESYDELLRIGIRSKLRALLCKSKEAGRGLVPLTDLSPSPWFQGDNPQIRIDIGGSEFIVYVDGRKVGVVNRVIRRGSVTHVRYWTYPARAEPIMGKNVTVSTYQQANLVP